MYTLVDDLPFPEDLINTVFTDLFLIASEVVNTNLTNCVEYFRTEYKYFTITKAENYLHDVWKGVSPPLKEEDIVNQWFAVIYWHKKKQSLFIGKAKRRFLQDVNGPTAAIEVECWKWDSAAVNTLSSSKGC